MATYDRWPPFNDSRVIDSGHGGSVEVSSEIDPGLAEALAGAEHTPEMALRADRADAEARAVRAARPRAVILPLVPGRSGAAPGSPVLATNVIRADGVRLDP